jgi:prolyl oligopeptidase
MKGSFDEDPYIWLENLDDRKVINWALNLDRTTREKLRNYSLKLYNRIMNYMTIPYVISVKITENGYFLLKRNEDFNIVLMRKDGTLTTVVSSKELGSNVIIHRFYIDRKGSKLSYFFSECGSDEGILRIIDVETGELIDELTGTISDIVWINKDR